MVTDNIDHLINGEPPTIDEFANFTFACSQLSYQQLYDAAFGFPKMHPLLKKVVLKHLEEKVQAENKRLRRESLVETISRRLTSND